MTDPRARVTPPPPAASEAISALDTTHAQILHWLDQLGELVTHLEATDWDTWSRDHARALVDFFSHTGRQHHLDEERHVFPRLVGRGNAEMEAHVERLQQDHGWIEENWLELMAQLRPVAEGFGGYDIDMLRHASGVFDTLLRDHIALEEGTVYPAARESLKEAAPSSS